MRNSLTHFARCRHVHSRVSAWPRPRMRDITSERLALVKTSGMGMGEPQRHEAHQGFPRFVSFVPSWFEFHTSTVSTDS